MAEHNDLGKKGEDEAVRYLRSKGYKIVRRNWRYQGLEIDIVAEDANFLVFIEVKTRTSASFGNPEDFVGKSRMRRMVEAADFFIHQQPDSNKPPRFDIIGLLWDGKTFSIEHIDDAFLPFL